MITGSTHSAHTFPHTPNHRPNHSQKYTIALARRQGKLVQMKAGWSLLHQQTQLSIQNTTKRQIQCMTLTTNIFSIRSFTLRLPRGPVWPPLVCAPWTCCRDLYIVKVTQKFYCGNQQLVKYSQVYWSTTRRDQDNTRTHFLFLFLQHTFYKKVLSLKTPYLCLKCKTIQRVA